MAGREVPYRTPKKAAAKKGYKDGRRNMPPKASLLWDESKKAQKYTSAYKRGAAERLGAEGPKKRTPVKKAAAKKTTARRKP